MIRLNRFRLLVVVVLNLLFIGCDNATVKKEAEVEIIPPEGWTLVWNDEFSGTSINTEKWSHEVNANGGGNNELQYYTARRANSRVEEGILIIEALSERFTDSQGTRNYTSARMITRGKGDWLYGRMEVNAKLPTGRGLWPAIWMMPTDSEYGSWAASGEIDIMEIIGHQPDKIHGTLHYGGVSPSNQLSGTSHSLPTGSAHRSFHTYAVEWEPNEIRWYIDDFQFASQTSWSTSGQPYPAPFDKRFYMILNVAVGGNWPGSPDASTVFPQRMEVDYVRVYKKNP